MAGRSEVASIDLIYNEDFDRCADDGFCAPCEMYVDEEEPRTDVGGLLTQEGEQFLFKQLNFLKFRADAIQSTVNPDRPVRRKQEEISRLLEEAGRVREEIARANLRLVISIAGRLSRSVPNEFDDMVAEGNAILLYAIDKFDYARGFRFSTYLTHAVQRHLYRYIKRRNRQRGQEVTCVEDHLAGLQERPGESEQEAEKAIAIVRQVLERVDETLDERERFILLGRLGLDSTEAKAQSFQSLGNQLGLSKERIRQLFHKAVAKLEHVARPFAESLEG